MKTLKDNPETSSEITTAPETTSVEVAPTSTPEVAVAPVEATPVEAAAPVTFDAIVARYGVGRDHKQYLASRLKFAVAGDIEDLLAEFATKTTRDEFEADLKALFS